MIDDSVLVSISCITYNHAAYIRQCLDGFLLQKTNFKFEILIHDDCSTDGTMEIIKEYENKYPDIIKPMYEKENQYQNGKPSGSTVWNLPRAKGKYWAMCEGDDFWTDEYKLQKEVDFLEQNNDYGMIYTRARKYFDDARKYSKNIFGTDYKNFKSLLLTGNCIPTLSICARTNLLWKYLVDVVPNEKNWLMGDYPMWLWMSKNSKIMFLPDITCVYRVLKNSASHSPNYEKSKMFINSTADVRYFFAESEEDYEIIKNIQILDTVIKALQLRIKINLKEELKDYKTCIMSDKKYLIITNIFTRFFYKIKLRYFC